MAYSVPFFSFLNNGSGFQTLTHIKITWRFSQKCIQGQELGVRVCSSHPRCLTPGRPVAPGHWRDVVPPAQPPAFHWPRLFVVSCRGLNVEPRVVHERCRFVLLSLRAVWPFTLSSAVSQGVASQRLFHGDLVSCRWSEVIRLQVGVFKHPEVIF